MANLHFHCELNRVKGTIHPKMNIPHHSAVVTVHIPFQVFKKNSLALKTYMEMTPKLFPYVPIFK